MIKGRNYTPDGYESCGKDLVPHGLSVTITAPEVFNFTGMACPDRHLQGAEALGADIRGIKRDDAGKFTAGTVFLSETSTKIDFSQMKNLGKFGI